MRTAISVDDSVNEFFQELMVDERLTLSLDPKSDRLNAAKPERHLRSTDAMVAVLTLRDPAPSEYIRWEVGLGLRGRKPQLIFVEDVLPDGLVPPELLQRRFSRRRLLRETRDHRHAVQSLKSYIGNDPPPNYQPMNTRRCCVVMGASLMGREPLDALTKALEEPPNRYSALPSHCRPPDDLQIEQSVQRAAVCIALVEGLTPSEHYLLGVARSSLTPCVLLTHDAAYHYHPVTPREYQPRYVPIGDADALVRTVNTEIDIFEEDYLELTEEKQIKRYRAFQESLLRSQRDGYSQEARQQVFNFMDKAEVDMSKDKIQVSHVVGPVNIKSRLDLPPAKMMPSTAIRSALGLIRCAAPNSADERPSAHHTPNALQSSRKIAPRKISSSTVPSSEPISACQGAAARSGHRVCTGCE
jgi:hypothetical protein